MNFRKDKNKQEEKDNKEEMNSTNESASSAEQLTEETNLDQSKNETEEKVKSLEAEIENYRDRLLRKAAEFENYKRRVENDQFNLLKYAAESLIIKLLPVIDDFERSLFHIKDAKDIDSIKDGIKLVYDKLMKMLDEQGVKPIEALGKPFDVHYHEAVLQRKADNTEPHTVIDEFEKGYLYKDRVIRHTKVAVSEDNQEDSTDNTTQPDDNDKKNNESESE